MARSIAALSRDCQSGAGTAATVAEGQAVKRTTAASATALGIRDRSVLIERTPSLPGRRKGGRANHEECVLKSEDGAGGRGRLGRTGRNHRGLPAGENRQLDQPGLEDCGRERRVDPGLW